MEDWSLPNIDLKQCSGCGFCTKYCPTGVLLMSGDLPEFVLPEACAYCGICEDVCPEGAVTLSYTIGFADLSAEE